MCRASEVPRERLGGDGLGLIEALVLAGLAKTKGKHGAPSSRAGPT